MASAIHRRVRRVLFLLSLTSASIAGAQSSDDFDPLDADGWPRGLTLDEVRELPACLPGELVVEPGRAITCRPPVTVGPAHIAFALDWSTGPVLDDRSSGGAHAMGFELAYAPTRSVQLGVRYELFGIGRPDDGRGLGNHFLGVAKYRHWTDEADRDAWTFGAGAGWAIRNEGLGGSAPLARVSLAREHGLYLDDNNVGFSALELAYERTLDRDGISTILASYRLGFELNVHEPKNLGRPRSTPKRWLTHSYDFYAGNALALGASLGLRWGRRLSLQTSAGFQFGSTEQTKQHGFDGGKWSVLTGPRVQLGTGGLAPYLQAQAGPAWVGGAGGGTVRGVGHAELGVQALGGCGGGEIAVWGRADLETRDVFAGGLLLRAVFGASDPSSASTGGCGQPRTPTFATRPVPPPPPVEVRHVEASPPPRIIVEPPPRIVVEVPPPPRVVVEVRPIIIDVELGIALPGARIGIDLRLLPAQLRTAAVVDVELTGPDHALRAYRGQLDGALRRSGRQVRTWRMTTTSSPVVRARFTIFP